MSETKLGLSPEELELATNASLILTKNAIIQKTIHLFGELHEQQKKLVDHTHLPEALKNSSPKISKGEYYQGLPYVVLDYPRVFEKNNIAAIRTLFWWGNFFSITLHLSGSYKIFFQPRILDNFSTLKQNDFYYCINDSEWEHHFEKDNYNPVDGSEKAKLEGLLNSREFIKLAYRFPVKKWNESAGLLLHYFSIILHMLEFSRPGDETALLPGGPKEKSGL